MYIIHVHQNFRKLHQRKKRGYISLAREYPQESNRFLSRSDPIPGYISFKFWKLNKKFIVKTENLIIKPLGQNTEKSGML